MNRSVIAYIVAATCLTAVILSADYRTNEEITQAIVQLRLEIQGIDQDFCERTDAKHEVSGFAVIDRSDGQLVLKQAKKAL